MFIFCHIMYILCCYYVYTFLLLCLYFVVTILLLFCYYFDSILITFFRKKSNIKKLKVFRVIWGGLTGLCVYIYYSKTSILTTLPLLIVVLFFQTPKLSSSQMICSRPSSFSIRSHRVSHFSSASSSCSDHPSRHSPTLSHLPPLVM